MIKSISSTDKLNDNIVYQLEERLAVELEERQELESCNGGYCSGVNW